MRQLVKRSLRIRLLGIILISLTTGLLIVGITSYFQFRDFLYSRVERELQNYTDLSLFYLNMDKFVQKDIDYMKAYADSIAQILDCRCTLIDINGVVLVDSEIPLDQTSKIDNHLARPEVQSSKESNYGFYIRHSNTLDIDLLYISKQLIYNNQPVGFVRLAQFANQSAKLLRKAQIYFALGGLIILLLSAFLVVLLSRRINKNVDILTKKAQQIASGDLATINMRALGNYRDEITEFGSSLNEMAIKLSDNLKKLSRERRDLSTVLSSVNDGILAIAPSKKIKFYNQRALQLLDCSLAEVDNLFFYKVIRNQHLNSLIDTFLAKPFLITDEITIDKDRVFEVVLTPFDMEREDGKGVVLVVRDISHFKKLEKIRRDFVANVSHEFKTPLAAIRGYSETLLDWGLDDPNVNRKYISKIVKQSYQLESLVLDLLQLARVERLGNIELVPFDPLMIIYDVLNEYREKALAKNQELADSLKLGQVQVVGDPEMFRSIFVNLLDNAIKYTPDGGNIMVDAQRNGDNCTFSVRDNGMGIPADEQGRIFERFYRVDKARSQTIEGTGLGLSIVKHMAELQKAEIWLQSRVNVGSCFYVKFRLAESYKEKALNNGVA